MSSYKLVIKRSAQKELDDLNDTLFKRIDAKIMALMSEPRPSGCKKLTGFKNLWRIRVGDYRVVYMVEEDAQTVTIIGAGHRGKVYD